MTIEKKIKPSAFRYIDGFGDADILELAIIRDVVTNVDYIIAKSPEGVAITPRLNAKGEPK